MKPFIEVDGTVFIVVGWETDQEELQRYEIRRLSEKETRLYHESRDELDIELFAWWDQLGRSP